MKIRVGFVSNSSSSSFCIIGVKDKSIIKELADAEKLKFDFDGILEYDEPGLAEMGYGVAAGKVVDFYGSDEESTPYDVGIELKDFGEDKTINQMKKEFAKIVKKKLDIDVPIKKIELLFGECGSG